MLGKDREDKCDQKERDSRGEETRPIPGRISPRLLLTAAQVWILLWNNEEKRFRGNMAAVKNVKYTHTKHARLLGGDTLNITLGYTNAHFPAHKSLENGKWVHYLG